MELTKKSINSKGVIKKITNLFSQSFSYVFMKVFARVYFFKSIFLSISRLVASDINNNDKLDACVQITNLNNSHDIVSDLKSDGCSPKIQLKEEFINNILQFTEKTPCYAYGDPKQGFYLTEKKACEVNLGKDILLAKYLNFKDDKIFHDFINSPILERIAKEYLGNSAKNIATQLWWTFPADVDVLTRSKAAHFFHRDVDAWGFVKFFFYITDVGEGDGPHVYVKKSHKPFFLGQIFKEKLRINRHPDTSIKKRFGSDSILPIFGKSGTGLAADTFGFHKGESPERHPRLMMCAVYAIEDYDVQEYEVDSNLLGMYSDLNSYKEV